MLWAYRTVAWASVASIGARIEECVISENVIHLCSSAGGCQAVLLPYQLLSGEWAGKKNMQIELQQHHLQTRKTKFLIADAIFLPSFSTSSSFSTCDYSDEHNLEQLTKTASKCFPYFSFFRMHRIKSLFSLPSWQQIFKRNWVAGTVQCYKFTAMRMVVHDNSYWVEKAWIKNNQVSITACSKIQ